MTVVLTIAGIAILAIGLIDMFRTLLHPTGQGRVSGWVLSATWWLSRATKHRLGSAVGPAAMVAVIVMWVALQGVGWALIYVPHIPGDFLYAPGIDPSRYSAFAEALYISFVTLTTLGYGDAVATDPGIRLAAPLEALTGFALLTAALTWFAQVYPPLFRRRALALELKGLADTGYADALDEVDAATASRVLDTLTAEVAAVRVDLTQHAEGYYFQEENPDLSLARQLPYALRMRDAARSRSEAAVRLSGEQLSQALDQLGAELRGTFLHTGDDLEAIFAAYATDHGQDLRT
ncbi:ion channel [Planctomonas psychrotolerans]|uniref:ion channel n=1 Tax=Planctomonas psychrotolerans TaxID=2528712 RepID=UPI00123B7B1F|nr:ion channel [Planctomonas psychrotolerans]